MLKLPASFLAYFLTESFACLLGCLIDCLFAYLCPCSTNCSLANLFASWLAFLFTYLLAFLLPCFLAFFAFLLSCLDSCFLLLPTFFLLIATCYLLPFSWNFRVSHTDSGMGGDRSPWDKGPMVGDLHVIRDKFWWVLKKQEMCIIRGKNGYFVFYVVKNWLLCSISCQKLAKYALFVKVIIWN